MKECVFCKIARKEIPVEIIEESENFLAFPDKNPIAKGHTLIISKKHFSNIIDLPCILGSELLGMIKTIVEKRIKEKAEGFNIATNIGQAAGQVVMHIHVHIIPRKKGDSVNLRKI